MVFQILEGIASLMQISEYTNNRELKIVIDNLVAEYKEQIERETQKRVNLWRRMMIGKTPNEIQSSYAHDLEDVTDTLSYEDAERIACGDVELTVNYIWQSE